MPVAGKRSKLIGRSVKRVTSYHQLGLYVKGFAESHIDLLVISGGHGLGKSQTVRRAMAGHKVCWIEGNVTAFGIYERLYRNRDQPIVMDDVDGFTHDRAIVCLLKSLCQTDKIKEVAWGSQDRFLESLELPRSFKTKSRLIVITNSWRALNRDVSALEDRGHTIHFDPRVDEVHAKAGEWFADQEIYEWFGRNLHRIEKPSFRNYIRAAQLKACAMEWREILGELPTSSRLALATEILDDPAFEKSEDRARAFEARGGGSRRTYFQYRRKILEAREAAGS